MPYTPNAVSSVTPTCGLSGKLNASAGVRQRSPWNCAARRSAASHTPPPPQPNHSPPALVVLGCPAHPSELSELSVVLPFARRSGHAPPPSLYAVAIAVVGLRMGCRPRRPCCPPCGETTCATHHPHSPPGPSAGARRIAARDDPDPDRDPDRPPAAQLGAARVPAGAGRTAAATARAAERGESGGRGSGPAWRRRSG